jgi:hypothetical protein
MYCLFCDNNLPEDALFCVKCGKLTSRGMSEGESENALTVAAASSPSDPYHPRPSTSYGPQPTKGGTQNTHMPLGPYEPLTPPPPPRRRSSNGFLKGLFIGMLVMLLLSGGLGGWLLLRQGALSSSTSHTVRPTVTTQTIVQKAGSTATTAAPQTVSLSTQTPLSDGRIQDWRSTLHSHLIESRWTLSTGQWSDWVALTYPPSNAGVTGLSADTQQSITYFTVQLDDGSCWQQHKLTTASDSDWTSFSSC